MANTDKTLKNKDQIDIYPITRERNVYDENNINLKEKFKSVVFNDNDVHKFAEGLYEESANEFDANLLNGVSGIIVSDNGEKITMPVVTSGNGGIRVPITLRELCPNMKVGETYTINFYRNYDDTNNFIYFVNSNYLWRPGVSRKITENDLNGEINFYANRFQDGYTSQIFMSEFSIVRGNSALLNWYPYNPNRHITNSEAEFLKEEFGKQKNELEFSNITPISSKGLQLSVPSNRLKIVGTSTSAFSQIIPLENPVYLSGEYSLKGFVNSIPSNCYINLIEKSTEYAYLNITNNKLNDTKVFSTETKVDAIWVWIGSGVTIDLEIPLMLCKGGEPTQYGEYNSSSHITNGQADFLKSECDKSLNKLHGQDYNQTKNGITVNFNSDSGLLSITGTVSTEATNVWFNIPLINTIPKDQRAYFGYKGSYTVTNDDPILTLTGNPDYTDRFGSYLNKDRKFKEGTLSGDVYYLRVYVGHIYVGSNYNIQVYPFINYDNIDEFHEWNGKHLTEIDAKPELLWVTTNSYTDFTPQRITTKDMSKFSKLLIGYKYWKENKNVYYTIVSKHINTTCYLNGIEMTATYTNTKARSFNIESETSIYFNDGYNKQSTTSGDMVPVYIYGLKY